MTSAGIYTAFVDAVISDCKVTDNKNAEGKMAVSGGSCVAVDIGAVLACGIAIDLAAGHGEGVFCGATIFTAVDIDTTTYGDWTVTTAATCTEDGERTRSCTVCGETDTQPPPYDAPLPVT